MAVVDGSLESRLKGLIRRPTSGGRGIAAARPEPTWLTSLKWPKAKEEPEDFEVSEESPPRAASATLLLGRPGAPGLMPNGPEEEIATSLRGAAGEGEERPVVAARESASIKRRVAEPEDETDTTAAPAKVADRGPGPTLPSGRTPVPPPPPPLVRRTGERPAVGPAPRPGFGPGPSPRTGFAPTQRPASPSGAVPSREGGPGVARPPYPSAGGLAGPAARRGPGPGYERRPGPAPGGAARPGGPGGPGAGPYAPRGPSRPYGAGPGARPPMGARGPGAPDNRGSGPRPGGPREWPA